ncbi:A/G-specific adenine glycosylase [Limnochorda pilosa]|uniref:A/G-specific adenine glycosylase n=1 Tax=Limnochorda pilosa TaxID=1555112 RepID=UPI0011875EB3
MRRARADAGPAGASGASSPQAPPLARAAVQDPDRWRAALWDHLLAWYRASRRDLPWRSTRDPYRVWLSEVMLQQTQVETVVPYYHRFLERFPDLASLAASGEVDVLKAWEGLGFYRRARLFRSAAAELAAEGRGVPDDPERFRRLPGVGPYTAGAVMSIAFGHRLPAVDGNAVRVLSRWAALEAAPGAPGARAAVDALAAWLVPGEAPGEWNQAIMELGARVCLPGGSAACSACPVERFCRAREAGLVHRIPPPRRRAPVREVELVLALICRDGRVLVRRRPAEGLLAGFWELPGIEADPGDRPPQEALARALEGLLGQPVRVGAERLAYVHRFSHRLWRVRLLEGFVGEGPAGRGAEGPGEDLAWVEGSRLGTLPVAAAHRPAMELARQEAHQRHHQQQDTFQGEEARSQAHPVSQEADPEGEEARAQGGHGHEQA